MLESVTIRRFKSLEHVEIPLGNITLIVGPNNAGKSSILQAIQFAVSVAQSLQMDGVSKWSNDSLTGTLSTEQLVYTPLRDVHALAAGGALRQGAARAINVEFHDPDQGSTSISVSRGKNKNIAISIAGRTLGERLENLEAPFSVVAPGLAGIPAVEEYRTPGIVRRAAARGDANSVFRNVLWTLKRDTPAWERFHNSLNEIFDDVELDVQFNENTDEHIQAWVRRNSAWLPIDSAGTGVLQAIQVLSYIGVYKPNLLVLDEPDSHLHPDNQRKLARLIDSMTLDGDLQVLISTHSSHLLDEFGKLDTSLHWISSGELKPESFDRVSALLELGALDIGDRLRNGQSSTVVITEDTKTKPIEALLLSSGHEREEFDIWSYASSSKTDSAIVLGRFIKETSPGTRVIIHRDRDYLDDEECAIYTGKITDAGIDVFITSGTDTESHFLNVSHLRTVYPEIDDDTLKDLVARATQEVGQKSVEMMINKRIELANQRKRTSDFPQPSPGSISTAATSDFEGDPERYRHGKKTLAILRKSIQDNHGLNRNIISPSSSLSVEDLEPRKA
ncbi:AAA family ATPase [Qaidamihabitans albus]|uniref:AAA family ATPase n=1 Tax=Qaidamihabitans albus TaxID=2795733 RepID=UPI0018F13264|nr:AAA family ATPase [Qaidamihabitans albus]